MASRPLDSAPFAVMRIEASCSSSAAWRSGMASLRKKPPPPIVAIGSPAMITAPRVTGTVSTRPSDGRQHFALRALLDDHLALRLGGGDLVAGDVDLSAQLVEALHGDDALVDQRLAALELGLRRLVLRLERPQLGIQGGDLEGDLVVAHDGRPAGPP